MKHLLLSLALIISANTWAEFDIGLKCNNEELVESVKEGERHWILIDRKAKKVRTFVIKTHANGKPYGYWENTFNRTEVTETPVYYIWSKYDSLRLPEGNMWSLNRETLVLDTRYGLYQGPFPCELSEPEEVTREIDFHKKEKIRMEEEEKLNKALKDAEQLKKNKI